MIIKQFFERLSYAELSNLSLSFDGNGTIEPIHHKKIIQHMNDGLLALYTKFPLCTKELLIEMVEGVTNYHLKPMYTESQYNPAIVPYPYIKDSGCEPFTGDLIRVIEVYDEKGNLPLNDSTLDCSVFTPVYNILQVPRVKDYRALVISYQAKHEILSVANLDANIELPDVLIKALSAYVAYEIYTNMNSAESTAKAIEHLNNFYRICDEAVATDIVSSSISTTTTKFATGGWV